VLIPVGSFWVISGFSALSVYNPHIKYWLHQQPILPDSPVPPDIPDIPDTKVISPSAFLFHLLASKDHLKYNKKKYL